MYYDYYQESPRVGYEVKGEGQYVCVRVCPICGRFVKADNSITMKLSGATDAPNATCKKHGRVTMPSEGWL